MKGKEKMSIYTFPAVFTLEEDGKYSINFPDLEGCYTCGDNLDDGILMAMDVLDMVLREYKKSGKDIPEPSDLKGECVYLVSVEL